MKKNNNAEKELKYIKIYIALQNIFNNKIYLSDIRSFINLIFFLFKNFETLHKLIIVLYKI